MSVKLPKAPATYDAKDQSLMRGAIERADEQNVKRNAATGSILLIATDDGSTMKGTINSAGTLTWIQVPRT